MLRFNKKIIVFTILLIFSTFVCFSQQKNESKEKNVNTVTQAPKKRAYDLAYEFLHKLKAEKVDTIIFYKRTCISCCDFFNVFYVNKEGKYLTKICGYEQPQLQTIKLTSNNIFSTLNKNFNELNKTEIKDNVHKQKDGSIGLIMVDHYCYSELKIYTKKDSIITDRIKDHDFDEYTDFESNSSKTSNHRETNDNYLENVNSKWNLFLKTIEGELEKTSITPNREIKTLRKNKSNNI